MIEGDCKKRRRKGDTRILVNFFAYWRRGNLRKFNYMTKCCENKNRKMLLNFTISPTLTCYLTYDAFISTTLISFKTNLSTC